MTLRQTIEVNQSNPSQDTFLSTLTGGGKIVAILGTFSTLIGDFLTPLAPLNTWVFFICLIITITLSVLWYRQEPMIRQQWKKFFPHQLLVFCLVLLCSFGVWFVGSLILPSREHGILGDNIPGFAKLQETLLGIHADVKEIKTDTTEIKGQTTEILQETKRIGNSIDDIGKLGGIVKNPQTPAEYYHNARLHELGGDFKSAFTDYEKYISFDQSFIDPFESYLVLLRSQQGNDAAANLWKGLQKKYPDNLALELIGLRFLSGKERQTALNQLAEKNEDFVPVYRELAQTFSALEKPERSKLDRDYEIKNLKKIFNDFGEDKFLSFYLDKNRGRELFSQMRSIIGEYMGRNEIPPRVFPCNTAPNVSPGGLRIWSRINDVDVTIIEYSFDEKTWEKAIDLKQGSAPPFVVGLCDFYIKNSETAQKIYVRYCDSEGKQSDSFVNSYDGKRFENIPALHNPNKR